MTPRPYTIYECIQCHGFVKFLSFASGNSFGATFWTDGVMDAPMMPDLNAVIICPLCKEFIWRRELETKGELPDNYLSKTELFSHRVNLKDIGPNEDLVFKILEELTKIIQIEDEGNPKILPIKLIELPAEYESSNYFQGDRRLLYKFIGVLNKLESAGAKIESNEVRKSLDPLIPDKWINTPIAEGPVTLEDWKKCLNDGVNYPYQEQYVRIKIWQKQNDKYRNNSDLEWKIGHEKKSNMTRILDFLDLKDPDDVLIKIEILRQLGRFTLAQKILNNYAINHLRMKEYFQLLISKKDRRLRKI